MTAIGPSHLLGSGSTVRHRFETHRSERARWSAPALALSPLHLSGTLRRELYTAACAREGVLGVGASVDEVITIMSCSVRRAEEIESINVLHFINFAVKTSHKVIGIL